MMQSLKRLQKVRRALHRNSASELRGVTCHMGSHSVTCHPTQVNMLRLTVRKTQKKRKLV